MSEMTAVLRVCFRDIGCSCAVSVGSGQPGEAAAELDGWMDGWDATL